METFLVRVWVPTGVATASTESEQLCAWLGAMAAEQRGVGKRAHAVEETDSVGG